jgi:flagellar hook-basal body complex protein FliE
MSIRGVAPDMVRQAYDLGSNKSQPSDGFAEQLGKMVGQVNEAQMSAGGLQVAAIRGEDVAVHDVMIASAQAGIAFNLMVEIRNKLVDAYKELMRTQV